MPNLKSKKNAFTLVDAMLALVILGVASMGLSQTLTQSLKSSDRVICRSVAHNIAVGYAEQIMANDYTSLRTALLNGSAFTLKSVSLASDAEYVEMDDVFYFEVRSEKEIVMDVDSGNSNAPKRFMSMRFTFNANDMESGADHIKALEMTLDYSYLPTARQASNEDSWIEDTVYFVKSSIPIY
ncbi:MAG: hypothetical protein ACI81V_001077 [Lentimonas sp.]|jgi:hypothetical protein